MFTDLINSIYKKNKIIQKVDFALIELNEILIKEVIKHPEVVNYTFEPLSNVPEKIVYGSYPKLYVNFSPYKTSIEYDTIIEKITMETSMYDIEKTIINLVLKKLQ